jgi:hypothetical protein
LRNQSLWSDRRAITGSCLCGGVAFTVNGELPAIQLCYCRQCRKAQGSAFAANIPVKAEQFQLTRGAELLQSFESSPGKQRLFCGRCGSPIMSKRESLPGIVRLRAGTLEGELPTKPGLHQRVAYKANWWTIADSLPQYPDAPPAET